MTNLIELPEATLARITSFLGVRALLSFSSTCTRAHEFVVSNDLLLWGSRCGHLGIEALTPWNCQSYQDLYSNLLHRHKQLLGVWTSKVPPYGSVLVVHLHAPGIIGSCLVNKKLNEPVHLRPVFEIRCDDGKQPHISCLRTLFRPASESGPEPTKHEAQLQLSADGCSFKLSCREGCKQDEFELEAHKQKELPEGAYRMETPHMGQDERVGVGGGMMGSCSYGATTQAATTILQPAACNYPEVADAEPEDAAEMVLQMLNMAMLELYRKDADPVAPVFSRLLLPAAESHALEGLWKGTYGPHGIETLLVVVEGDLLIGTKLTGDYNVPAGEITFRATLSGREQPSPSEQTFTLPQGVIPRVDAQQLAQSNLPVVATYPTEGQVARPGFHSPSFIPAKLLQFSDDCFGILWHSIHTFSLFRRLPLPHVSCGGQDDDWTASTTAGGGEQVLPEGQQERTMPETGARDGQANADNKPRG